MGDGARADGSPIDDEEVYGLGLRDLREIMGVAEVKVDEVRGCSGIYEGMRRYGRAEMVDSDRQDNRVGRSGC